MLSFLHSTWGLKNNVTMCNVAAITMHVAKWPIALIITQAHHFLVSEPDPRTRRRRRVSLVPRPSPHVRERGSGVLSDFSCHSSPI